MRERAHSGSPFEADYGFSRAVRVGDRVLVAGTAPIPAPGTTLAATPFDQMMRCGAIVVAALEELGASVADVVRTRMFIASPDIADEIGRAHREIFGAAEPAATMVVAGLLDRDWLVEIEVDAVVGEGG